MTVTNAERAELYNRYGQPVRYPLELALEALGLDEGTQAAAYRYSSYEAAVAFAAANDRHGFRSLGIRRLPGGAAFGVVHLPVPKRGEATPDGWKPEDLQPHGPEDLRPKASRKSS